MAEESTEDRARTAGAGQSASELRERIFERNPEARHRWQRNEPRRRLALALLDLRKRANLTQKQVAEAAGWNPRHVARMESATGPWPNRESLNAYIHACDPEAAIGLVIAHPEGEEMHIDKAVAFGQGPADSLFETLAEDDPDDEPSTRLAAMSAAARDT
jgi:transcriptional regulator with XRE-family HTH domain